MQRESTLLGGGCRRSLYRKRRSEVFLSAHLSTHLVLQMFNLALGLGSTGKPCFIYLFFICPLSKNRCVPHLSAKMPCQSVAEAPVGSPLAVFMSLLPWNLHNRFSFGRFPQQNFLDNLVEAVARDRLVERRGDLEKVGPRSSFCVQTSSK